MIRYYLKNSIRYLFKNKLSSFINIIGLTLAITVSLSIVIILCERASYDNFYPNPASTYRITTTINGFEKYANSPVRAVTDIESSMPDEIQWISHVLMDDGAEVLKDNQAITAHMAFVDQDFFKLTGFEIMSGNSESFKGSRTLFISDRFSENIFGDSTPVGKSIEIKDYGTFEVSGIYKMKGIKSHLNPDMLLPYGNVQLFESRLNLNDFWKSQLLNYTYITLMPGVSDKEFSQSLNLNSDLSKQLISGKNPSIKRVDFSLQPITNIMRGEYIWDRMAVKAQPLLFIPLFVLVLIVLMAIFNLTNIAFAKSLSNAKSIGMRKILGSSKFQIQLQTIFDTVLMAVISMILAIGIISNDQTMLILTGRSFNFKVTIELAAWFMLISVGIGIITGALPAWIISRVKPLSALRDLEISHWIKKYSFQKILLFIQFTISGTFIIVFLVMNSQINFMVNSDYGFNPSGIITFHANPNQIIPLEAELNSYSGIKETSFISSNFGMPPSNCKISLPGQNVQSKSIAYFSADNHFIDIYGLKLVAGTNFPDKMPDNQEKYVLLNQQAMTFLGINDPVGKQLIINDSIPVQIVGIIKDFHYDNFKRPIGPLVIRYIPSEFQIVNARVSSQGIQLEKLNKMLSEKSWNSKQDPVKGEPLDKMLKNKRSYRRDFARLSIITVVTIIISCLGLLSMTLYYLQTQLKAISIRKVLGGTTFRIVKTISGVFIRLLIISGIIGTAAGRLLGNALLNEFTYKPKIGLPLLFTGFSLLMVLTLFIVGSLVTRETLRNPVLNLRNE